jgi:hypothetical protein
LVPVVQQAHGVVLTQALQAVHLHCLEVQQQSHQPTAAVVVAEAQVLPSVQAVRQQMDSRVVQVVFHQPLAARSEVQARVARQVITSAVCRITAEVELAVLTAVQRRHQLHLATMQAPQVA